MAAGIRIVRILVVEVAVGLTAAGLPEQIAALDEAVESLRRDQPMWHVDMGRAATTRTVQIRLQARDVDEAMQIVKLEVDRLLKLSSLAPPPELRWARPRQVRL